MHWLLVQIEGLLRRCKKSLSRKMSTVSANGYLPNGGHWKSLGRMMLYTITVFTVAVAIWNLLPSRGQVITLTLTSSNEMIKAVYKCAYPNQDGSVDLVFNIPKNGEDLLRLNNLTIAKPPQRVPGNKTVKAARNITTKEVRSKYPISLDADYVINTLHLCPVGQVDYIIIVHSATAYSDRRKAIRETFGGKRLFGHSIVQRVVFLLGTTIDPGVTRTVHEEALIHKDIVQGNFADSYHNLTHKGVLGYRWVSEHCPQAKFIIKIDDDVFLNPFKLVQNVLPQYKDKVRTIACHLRPSGTSLIERGKGKWQIHEDEFKGLKYYPFDYCNGYFVIITSDLIRPLLNAAGLNPFFWVDDVYLFGMLPATVGSMKFADIRANLTLSFNTGKTCYMQHGNDCRYLGVSQWRAEHSNELWYSALSNLTASAKRELHVFGLS